MNEDIEKILRTIKYCAGDYMKQEEGIQCFEWSELWVLNEYIKKLQQENEDLKEKVILLRASEPMLELEKYYGERDLYKEVIEEVRKSIKDFQEYIDEAKEFYSDLDDNDVVKVSNLQILNNQMVRNYDLLQILDKVKGE